MITHDIPLPRLLNASGGTEKTVRPIKMSVNLSIVPLSYASLELPRGESLPARGYVELFTSMGSVGIYRVRSPQDAYGEDITTAELEHAIVEVGDYVVRGEYDEMMAANTAMQTVFNHYRGAKWQLGSVSALGSGQIALQASYNRVLDAMIAILDQKPDCMMAFDFTTTPWTVSIVARGTTVTAEGRISRNINAAKVIYDDTELCTRVYYQIPTTEDAITEDFPTFDQNTTYGKGTYLVYSNKLYRLTADHAKGVTWANTSKELVDDSPSVAWTYLDANTLSDYGLVERRISTAGMNYTEEEADAIAQAYLEKNKEPRVTIDISAEELSYVTGETYDSFTIGKLFRLALSDYNVTVERNITEVSWDDVFGRPEDIHITLADEEDTAITFLHDLDAKGGAGGGGGGRSKQEQIWTGYRTLFEKDDYHFSLIAQRFNKAEEILQQAGIYINADGVLTFAEDNERNIGSKFAVTASAINAEVTRATGAESTLSGSIAVESDRISLVVEGTGANAKIKPASIVAAINQQTGSSQVHINADQILVGDDIQTWQELPDWIDTTEGLVAQKATIVDLNAVKARVSTLEADSITTQNLSASIAALGTVNVSGLSSAGNISATGSISGGGFYIGTTDLSNAIANFGTATESSGRITIPTTKLNGGQGTPINFNIADTQYYKNGVSAAYTNGSPVSGTLGSRQSGVPAPVYNISVTKGDGTKVNIQVNLASAYSDARVGYTYGIFNKAALTLQGSSDTVFVEASSGGSDYYKASEPVTYYTRNTTATRLKNRGTERHYDVNGKLIMNANWYYVDSSGTAYYTSSGIATVTPIDTATKKHLLSTIRYKAGTSYSTTTSPYYTKS